MSIQLLLDKIQKQKPKKPKEVMIKKKKIAKLTFTSKAKQVEKLQSQKPPKKAYQRRKTTMTNSIIKAHLKSLYLRGIMEIHPTPKGMGWR